MSSVNDFRRVGMRARLFVELKMEVELKLVLMSTQQNGSLATMHRWAALPARKTSQLLAATATDLDTVAALGPFVVPCAIEP